MRKLCIDADDSRVCITVEMDRAVPVSSFTSVKGARVYDFKGLRFGKPGYKERPESLLAYSIRVAPRRAGLRIVVNRKHFLPEKAVAIDADYIKSNPPTYRILFLNRLKQVIPGKKKGETIVVIDPGHGGIDPGNLGCTVQEKTITSAVSYKLARLVNALPHYRAYLTRNKDTYVPLDDRARLAYLYGADLMISIHCNAFKGKAKVRGFEVYMLSKKGVRQINRHLDKGERRIFRQTMLDAFRLAQSVRDKLHDETGLKDRGVKQDELVVTRTFGFPSILVEIGFLSDAEEEAKLKKPAFQDRLAKAIRDGILLYARRKKENWRGPARPNRPQKHRTRKGRRKIPKDGYVVKRGDSVSKIALAFGVTTEAIVARNGLKDPDKLRIGQVLFIPPRKEPAGTAKTTDTSRTTDAQQGGRTLPARNGSGSPESPVSASMGKTGEVCRWYTVKDGDALSVVARRFGVSTKTIVLANGLRSADRIRTGQRLRVPLTEAALSTGQKQEAGPSQASPVRRGDRSPRPGTRGRSSIAAPSPTNDRTGPGGKIPRNGDIISLFRNTRNIVGRDGTVREPSGAGETE